MINPAVSPRIYRFETLVSTNQTARELIDKGAEEGTVVVAVWQSAGRGRNGHQWHSPKGGLYFSVVFYPKEGRRVTDISLLAGTAVAQGLKAVLPKSADISVKWPNDVLINWKKVAGVLCEATRNNHNPAVIVGVGVNVNISGAELLAFKDKPFPATSVSQEWEEHTFDREEILQMILKKMFGLYELYEQQGFLPIQYLWEKNCPMIGKKIELREGGWRPSDPRDFGVMVGTLLGIDERGALVVSNARGERRQYVSGEITCFWP